MNVSKHLSIQSYSGSLNQSEFVERYFIIKSRIKQGFTREELAFLLGRTPYFMTDYEELSPIKLELADFDIINSVLRGCNHEALNFDSKDGIYDISNEKRLVRVIKTAYADHITYEFHHHWKISGEIKPLRVVEPVICTAGVALKAMRLITDEIKNLLQLGYFKSSRSPLEIQKYIWHQYKYDANAWSVTFLKNIIYHFVKEGQLAVDCNKGRFTYYERGGKKNC